jgi:hypothetical protein
MKPSAFNSIDSSKPKNLKSLAQWYTKQVFNLYTDLLEEHGASDAESIVEVETTYLGRPYKRSTVAGWWFVRQLLFYTDPESFPEPIKKIDSTFIENCPCENPQDILDYLSLKIMIIGQSSSELDEWMEYIGDFSDCAQVEEEIKNLPNQSVS